MKIKSIFTALALLLSISTSFSQEKKNYLVNTIAFYNLENLFDTVNDPNINDEDFIYTPENYKHKLQKLERVISQIGTSGEQKNSPVILGVAEIENRQVLEDLCKRPLLAAKGYSVIHFDSPDRRGIDTGFLYQKGHFQPTSYKNYALIVTEDETDKKAKDKEKVEDTDDNVVDIKTKRIYTRDQILMTGLLDGEEMHFIVNHWPSRRGGVDRPPRTTLRCGRRWRRGCAGH